MSKLTKLHINLIGAGIVLVVALILYFALVKPKNDQTQQTNAAEQSAEQAGGTSVKVAQHKKDLQNAQVDAVNVQREWNVYASRYMPDLRLDGPDVLPTYEYLVKDIPTRFGKWVTAWYDAQRKYGITRLSEFPLAAFPPDPNYVSNLKSITLPDPALKDKPWLVAVEAKNFDSAMAHLMRFNSMAKHGMPVINNVALQGQSPHLLLSYELTLYIIPPAPPAPPDPMLGGAPAPPGAGGSFGSFGGSGGSFGASGGAAYGSPSGGGRGR